MAAGAFTVAALITHAEAPLGVTLLAPRPRARCSACWSGCRRCASRASISRSARSRRISSSSSLSGSTSRRSLRRRLHHSAARAVRLDALARARLVLLPAAGLCCAVLLVNLNWLRSAYGRAWMAIRHRDIAAESLGINVRALQAARIQRQHLAHLRCRRALGLPHGFVSVEAFDFDMLIQYLAMVIIGGLGSVLGACPRRGRSSWCCRTASASWPASCRSCRGSAAKAFELQIGVFGLIMLLFSDSRAARPRRHLGARARYFQLWPFRYRAWEAQ
jgi:ABC-type branched-subunit amino acid transport system permease subunit